MWSTLHLQRPPARGSGCLEKPWRHDQLLISGDGQHTLRTVSRRLSQKEPEADSSPADKMEWLISEARKLKAQTSGETTNETRAEDREARMEESRGEARAQKGALKEDILATLTDTSRELSRVIGLLERQEIVAPEPRILPRYCCYCGRYLLPNALYCDRCGASVEGT